MSAITETQPGGEMVCILEFSARPRDTENQPIPGPRRDFHVGERVRYIASFFKNTPEDNPTGYMAIFEPLDPKDHGQRRAHAASRLRGDAELLRKPRLLGGAERALLQKQRVWGATGSLIVAIVVSSAGRRSRAARPGALARPSP